MEFRDYLFLLLILVCILIEVLRNFWVIEILKKRPVYWFSVVLRILVAVVLNYLYAKGVSIELTAVQLSMFACLFDPLLNLLRNWLADAKLPLLYINRTRSAGWWDGLLAKLPNWAYLLYILLEWIIFLLALYMYQIGYTLFMEKLIGQYPFFSVW